MTEHLKSKLWKKLKKSIFRSCITHKIYWVALPSGKTNYSLTTYKNTNWQSSYCEELK